MFNPNPYFRSPTGSFLEPVPIPDTDPDDDAQVTVSFGLAWLPLVCGALSQLMLPSTWIYADEDELQLAQGRATNLINMICGAAASRPGIPTRIISIRWNTTCNCVQRTDDGGATWTDAPTSDPRNAPNPPHLTGTGRRCNAAASVVRYMSNLVAEAATMVNAGASASAIGLFIATYFGWLGPYAVLIDLFALFAIGLVAAGYAAITGAMTSTVYDEIECMIYCRADADGVLSDAAFTIVLADIAARYSGVTEYVAYTFMQLLGRAGANTAGASGIDTDDCSTCDDGTWTHTFTTYAGWTLVRGTLQGNGDINADFAGGVFWCASATLVVHVPACAVITNVSQLCKQSSTGTVTTIVSALLGINPAPVTASRSTSFSVSQSGAASGDVTLRAYIDSAGTNRGAGLVEFTVSGTGQEPTW